MVGTGYAVDAFGEVMAEGGAGLIISSQAAYMYPIPSDIELPPPVGAVVVPASTPSHRASSSPPWPTMSLMPMVRATSA